MSAIVRKECIALEKKFAEVFEPHFYYHNILHTS